MDSARSAGNRRRRRAQTARLAVSKFRTRLLRHVAGARQVWSVVRGPRVEADDRRQRHRAVATTQQERTRVSNRRKGRRAAPGVGRPPHGDVQPPLASLRRWAGSPLPPGLRPRLGQEWEHVTALAQRIAPVDAARRVVLQTAEDAVTKKVQQLLTLKGIGTNSAGGFVMEFFGWRACRHGQAGGALRGVTPTPSARGTTASARGIANAGTSPSRALAIAMAWGWRRCQPERALTHWYQQRFGQGRSRLRRLGLVALARQLLIAWWRCVEPGVLPDGAALTAPVRLCTRRAYTGGATGLGGAAREETGCAPRADREQGLPTPGLHRRRERRQDQGCGRQRPTRRAGRLSGDASRMLHAPSPERQPEWSFGILERTVLPQDRRDDRKSVTTAAT